MDQINKVVNQDANLKIEQTIGAHCVHCVEPYTTKGKKKMKVIVENKTLKEKLNNSIKIDRALENDVMHFHMIQAGIDISNDQISSLCIEVYKTKEGYTIFCEDELIIEDMQNSSITNSFDSWSKKIDLATGKEHV